jgi:hypothetical protein
MNNRTAILKAVLSGLLITGLMLTNAQAKEDAKPAVKKDKTGTNPVNFQRDLRIYNEFTWLNTAGDGTQNLTTLEFRTPLLEGKWQWRVRTRYNSITADLNDDNIDDIDEDGMGDTDMRFITVPILNMASKTALALGLEVFFDTASDDALGAGSTSLGPQVFFVKFFSRGLFAPGLQYIFSVDEDDGRAEVDQFLIDLNLLIMAKDKQSWFFTDPQIVFDNENDYEFAIVDLEYGWMMSKWIDLPGHSFYVRPSFGVGGDRPTDYSVELGYKMIGW